LCPRLHDGAKTPKTQISCHGPSMGDRVMSTRPADARPRGEHPVDLRPVPAQTPGWACRADPRRRPGRLTTPPANSAAPPANSAAPPANSAAPPELGGGVAGRMAGKETRRRRPYGHDQGGQRG
jgi:hypothetical protein